MRAPRPDMAVLGQDPPPPGVSAPLAVLLWLVLSALGWVVLLAAVALTWSIAP
jgi:hypothetical protein